MRKYRGNSAGRRKLSGCRFAPQIIRPKSPFPEREHAMLGFRYLKTAPTTYVIQFRNGHAVREGAGLSFFYFAPTSIIVRIPQATQDVPFVFNEVTADFQDVTIQGELTFRIHNPALLAKLLDFSLDSRHNYETDDPDKLNERLVRSAQILARAHTQGRSIKELLINSDALVHDVLDGLRGSTTVSSLGVEVLAFSVSSIKGTPELSKAMQAETREELLRRADEAVTVRRNAAVEQERTIKENELQTEIAIEQKRRQVRETQMEADIVLEEQKSKLVERRVENDTKEAEARAAVMRSVLQPLKEVDWRTLMAASAGGANAETLIAMAFRDLADNAGKIENLNISPELLTSLLGKSPAIAPRTSVDESPSSS